MWIVDIPKERRNKLDNKLEKCIFIGYKDGFKGYKMWNPITRIVVYSRDVILREDKSTFTNEEVTREKELENIEFNWNNEIHDSDGLSE